MCTQASESRKSFVVYVYNLLDARFRDIKYTDVFDVFRLRVEQMLEQPKQSSVSVDTYVAIVYMCLCVYGLLCVVCCDLCCVPLV